MKQESWFIRYKLYHIPFWFLYNYIWWAATLGDPVKAAIAIFASPFAIKFSFYVIFEALAVYLNLYFLIPLLLEKRRFAAYIFWLSITILCTAAIIVPGYYLSAFLSGRTLQDLYGVGSYSFYHLFMGSPLSSATASMTLAMSIKLAKNWLQTQRKEQLLKNEKLETELKFLKHQFNPHFLFNTINSIFFLIHRNPDMASASLAKFSDILRYQLYECNEKQTLLSKEIACLQNSIELERLRQNENVKVTLRINRQHADELFIAPFILMTFVENAFKHVSKDSNRHNWISIKLDLRDQKLDFCISNSCTQTGFSDAVYCGGIGLKNVQRSLDLIYPGKYWLEIKNDVGSFTVSLQLQLSPAGASAPAALQKAI